MELDAEPLLRVRFEAARIPYPPSSMVLIGLKRERVLQVYATGTDGKYRFIREYPVLAASGRDGPKKCRGDLQRRMHASRTDQAPQDPAGQQQEGGRHQ